MSGTAKLSQRLTIMADLEIPKSINSTTELDEIHNHVHEIQGVLSAIEKKKPLLKPAILVASQNLDFWEKNQLHEVRKAFE